jgi:hypothetical protein
MKASMKSAMCAADDWCVDGFITLARRCGSENKSGDLQLL